MYKLCVTTIGTASEIDYEATVRSFKDRLDGYVDSVRGQVSVVRTRPTWDQYFMRMAEVVGSRATCDRKLVGAVVVDPSRRVVSTGYNGAPRGMPHCDDEGHDLRKIAGRVSCRRTLHAESNALDDAGRDSRGGTLYVTVIPCFECAKRAVNAGIVRVVYGEYYESQGTELVLDYFESAGVEVTQCSG